MTAQSFFLVSLICLAALTSLAIYYEKDAIEAILQEEAAKALIEHDTEITTEQLSFDGRDAVILGQVSSEDEKLRIEQLLLEVWDVRAVNNQLWVESDTAAASRRQLAGMVPDSLEGTADEFLNADAAQFRLTYQESDSIRLVGVFSDSVMHGRVIDVVQSSFPGFSVSHDIRVDTLLERPNWYPSLMAIVPTVGLVTKPTLRVTRDGKGFALGGEVFGGVQREVITEDALNAVGDSLVLNTTLDLSEADVSEEDVRVATLRARIQNLLATTRIQFQINTSDLTAESLEVLGQIAILLNDAPDIQVEVQGHTDNTGSIAVNRSLSQLRAESVRTFLIRQGVDGGRLTAVGYGPGRPIATNFTYEGRVTNRRVEFSLKGGS